VRGIDASEDLGMTNPDAEDRDHDDRRGRGVASEITT
jgi:hypothetical protein